MKRLFAASAIALLLAGSAMAEPATAPDVALTDPAAEARARDLFVDIRCVVCQHESIADSPAGIAADMRQLVREQIRDGKTDAEIRQDLVRRYGDYVLFTPPFRWGTLILWLGPLMLVMGGGLVFWARSRRRKNTTAPLDAAEEAELARWIAPTDATTKPEKQDI